MRLRAGVLVASVFLAMLLSQASCSSVPPAGAPADETQFGKLYATGEGYTLVNLHPDESRRKLSAANYQGSGLIPLCTKVEFTYWSEDSMQFEVVSTGREYTYDYHDDAVVLLDDHLALYFGDTCDPDLVEGLSEVDRKGVDEGRVVLGMTKEAAVLSIGYPILRETPSMLMKDWQYRKSPGENFVIVFDENEKVSEIRE